MKLIEDIGILLSYRKYTESSFILKCFLKHYGVFAGMYRVSKKQTTLIAGKIVAAKWQARLEEQLGFFNIEPISGSYSLALQSPIHVSIIQSGLALCEITLKDRDPHPQIFDKIAVLLNALAEYSEEQALAEYALFELVLLKKIGFGMDLEKCAVTGNNTKLYYISPKTGRAVIKAIGDPYREKLFKIPDIFLENNQLDYNDILNALNITGSFLHKWFLQPNGLQEPFARKRLLMQITGKIRKAGN